MKGLTLKVGAALVLAVATITAGAHGLTPIMTANIPFDFQIRDHQLPAGRYTVESFNPGALIIRGQENGKGVFFTIYGGKSDPKDRTARLVFRRYGDRYFLGSLWDGTSMTSMELGKSSAERKVQAQQHRNLAQDRTSPETVTVMGEAGN
jgi:hypothetical protein